MFCSAEHRDTAQNFSSAVVEPAYCKEMRLDFQVRSSRPAYIRESHRCLLYEIAEGPLKPFSHLWLDITGLAKPQLLIDDAEDISCIVGKLEVFTFEFREGEHALAFMNFAPKPHAARLGYRDRLGDRHPRSR